MSCVVCGRDNSGKGFCRLCRRSYDDMVRKETGDLMPVIVWAATRARWFEQRRKRKDRR